MLKTELSQIQIFPVNNNLIKVFVKKHNFFSGWINMENETFYSVPRSDKNLFYLLDRKWKQGCLGLNSELLSLSTYRIVKIKFNDTILKCSRAKWLREGIKSPFCDERVDLQICLPLPLITLDEPEYFPTDLFEEVA